MPDATSRQWPGKRVLELGCGAGAVGLTLAKRNAQVTLSDRGFILDLARANARRNFPPNGDAVRIVELSWYVPGVARICLVVATLFYFSDRYTGQRQS